MQIRRAPFDLSILRPHIILSSARREFGFGGDGDMRQDMSIVEGGGRVQIRDGGALRGQGRGRDSRRWGALGCLKAEHHRPVG
jgi:hypothetical protein